MLAAANFTLILPRVPAGNPSGLWLHLGTVRYGFLGSWFFNGLRDRFVPVRFRRRRYGTVHPSIRGCTRTTPVPPDPHRRARPRSQSRGGADPRISIEPVAGQVHEC
jgi:hypothetical protein